ncbi:protein-tyrosine phosphatase family protein [Photobacterium alginatilyticum]|uniref:protein-tyrosine-phosphatase n=1 Tax=Photobacterium alginatilyticum TaxID=1775171 RepID=A0ABW9YL88_9GAMM|nr:protein-tyrosine phosphatase family protein [Photobacterium alginatilyticum]NBI54612.1 tyrosine protein phosphatase [Photobacterium alginatilyticum]
MIEESGLDTYQATAHRLMMIKGGARCFAFDPNRDRFNLLHCADTSVRNELNANRIKINDRYIAIASQFPYQHQLESHFQMLVENRTPVLVVLASDTDIQGNDLPDYFSNSSTYGNIRTQSVFSSTEGLGSGIEARVYQLNVAGYDASIDIPVVHVHNWPDHQTVSTEATINLVALIERITANKRAFYEKRRSRAVLDSAKLLPVIHCRAGVGRTGQTIATMAMNTYPNMSLEAITRDLRASRNDYMIQTSVQMETLVRLMEEK